MVARFRAKAGLLSAAIALGHSAYAMEPMTDTALSDVTGQAFVSIGNSSSENADFTRVDVGLNIETQINADEVVLGEYYRWAEDGPNAGAPCPECTGTEAGLEANSADIQITDFALGTIARDAGTQFDGKFYDAGQIVPFYAENPYLEFVKEGENIIGARIGFGKAMGMLSGDFKSLTGNMPITIDGQLISTSNPDEYRIVSQLQGVTSPNQKADGSNDYATGGQLKSIRASYLGIPDGTNFKFLAPSGSTFSAETNNCLFLGRQTCFSADSFKSVTVGERLEDGSLAASEDMFLSIQTKEVTYTNPNTGKTFTAPAGFFLNLPNGDQLSLQEAAAGLSRQRTEHIDRFAADRAGGVTGRNLF